LANLAKGLPAPISHLIGAQTCRPLAQVSSRKLDLALAKLQTASKLDLARLFKGFGEW